MPCIKNRTSLYVYGLGTTIFGACRFDKNTAANVASDINGGELVATVLQYSASRYVVMVANVMTDRAFYVDIVTSRDATPVDTDTELAAEPPTRRSEMEGAHAATQLLARGIRTRTTLACHATSMGRRAEDSEAFADGFWNVVDRTIA